jgi:hypothetical protein
VTESWRKRHNEEFLNLYSSPSILRMNESSKMMWAEHIARIGKKKKNAYGISMGNPK